MYKSENSMARGDSNTQNLVKRLPAPTCKPQELTALFNQKLSKYRPQSSSNQAAETYFEQKK